MPNPKSSISQLQQLGYDCGIAHGDVATEETALAAAQAAADPQSVIEKANQLTADTLQTLSNIGKLPDTDAEKLELSQKIGAAALGMLTEKVTERVEFHQRALAIAQTMPDVWHVSGPGVQLYVSCRPDGTGWDDGQQAMLEALADPGSHAERLFQINNPDAMQEAALIGELGVAITRPSPGADEWAAEGRTFAAADLAAFLTEIEARPVTPPVEDQVAALVSAITSDPSISDAAKRALTDAVSPQPDA